MEVVNIAPFINRESEMRYLRNWVAEEPKSLLFVYGPKSSGKTTLLHRFIKGHLADSSHYDLKHFNLREIFLEQYKDFLRVFFEHDYAREKGDVKEKREYDLKVFKLTVEALKGLESRELDPFVVMKRELSKINAKGIRPVIVIDELQALEGIYLNGQRELLKELFNFFVAVTKESHLCHVIIASSDGYFIERIYNDSKLKKTSEFLEVEYLAKRDVESWLNDLEQNSAIKEYELTARQIERIWESFGGSCFEISRFIGDLLMFAEGGGIPDEAFEILLKKKLVQARSLYVDYAYTKKREALFLAVSAAVRDGEGFTYRSVTQGLPDGFYDEEQLRDAMGDLVRENFLAYNPVTAEYTVQGRSMQIGLRMFVEMVQ